MSEAQKHFENSHELHDHAEPSHEHHIEQRSHIKLPENDHVKVEMIKEEIERQNPVESSELLAKLDDKDEVKQVRPPNKELKRMALINYLSDIRSNLNGIDKIFSKFIHQPKINAISEFSGKTIVRPSAILFAGFFMFLGSVLYLYVTYHTDARYNFLVALFLFVGGFIAGLIVELFYKLFFKKDF